MVKELKLTMDYEVFRHLFSKCPASIGNLEECEKMQQRVRSTINKRLKQWNILKQIYRGKIEHHGDYFRIVAIVTRRCIDYGERLSVVEYQDPNYGTTYYFDEMDVDEDDDESEY